MDKKIKDRLQKLAGINEIKIINPAVDIDIKLIRDTDWGDLVDNWQDYIYNAPNEFGPPSYECKYTIDGSEYRGFLDIREFPKGKRNHIILSSLFPPRDEEKASTLKKQLVEKDIPHSSDINYDGTFDIAMNISEMSGFVVKLLGKNIAGEVIPYLDL